MSDKKSSFDLQSDMKSYLISLHDKSLKFVKSCIYAPIDHQHDDIVYIRNRHDLVTGIHEGLDSIYMMQKNKIKEQKTLRANSKNYIKKYYADGLLNEIECFVEGKFDCRFIAVYEENKRYLIPFSETGSYYPTYSHILEKHENYCEEYMIDNVQIVYRKYTQQTEKIMHIYTSTMFLMEHTPYLHLRPEHLRSMNKYHTRNHITMIGMQNLMQKEKMLLFSCVICLS